MDMPVRARRVRRRRGALLALVAFLACGAVACGGATSSLPPGGIPTVTLGPTATALPTATASPTVGRAVPTRPPAVIGTPSIPLDGQGFADAAFRQLWDNADRDVALGRVQRTWLWGPKPVAVKLEPYAQAPGGSRLVEYFDKSRMEINDPGGDRSGLWFVTNGLLTAEMVSGRVQVGQDTFEDLGPADVPVTGDLEDPDQGTPRYRDFGGPAAARAANQVGAPVTASFSSGGRVGRQASPPATVTIASYDETLGHNVPDVFVRYFLTLEPNWVFVTGYPISEPYWVTARFGGQTRTVLVQLFERRALTYSPTNDPTWQVEFANIGLHYYRWRYHDR